MAPVIVLNGPLALNGPDPAPWSVGGVNPRRGTGDMNSIPVSDVRTFAFMGHTASGKTTLVDALLFKLGQNDRMGLVTAGSSMADYTNEEKTRKISMFAKPFSAAYKAANKTYGLTFVDTPGYLDFYGQVVAATRAAETGVIVVDATAGIQVGTRRAWKCCNDFGLVRAVAISGLDKDNADFDRTVEQIQSTFGAACVPVVLPTPDRKSVVSVLSAKNPPAELAARVESLKTKVTELAAETDDSLIEKFLGGEALSREELASGLRKAVARGSLVPIFACQALKDIGITEFLDGVADLFPSPADRKTTDKEGNAIDAGADAPFVGFVWRTVNDSFVGQLTFVRVLGGTLSSDSEVINVPKDQKERVGAMLLLNGRKQDPITSATAGDVVALPKLKVTGVGDTLCAPGHKRTCVPIKFPNPVVFQAVKGKTQADEDKIGIAVARVAEEDPTLQMIRNTETHEMLLGGLGDVHIDVAVERMKTRSNVEVLLSTPKVPYRETVTAKGEGHYKHKKQTGGRGQYAEVYLRVEPKRQDDPDWFVDAVVGGVIPHNFIPAVQKGLVEGVKSGALAGFMVTDVKASVYDGSYHDVDSSEIAFKIASIRAFKDAMTNAKPVLLEPIMRVRVMVPEQFMGDVNGDLNHRRGRIQGMDTEGGMQVIIADVPQSELFRYAAELRSMTGGQGSFEMEFNRYEVVPSSVAQKVIAEAQKNKKDEDAEA